MAQTELHRGGCPGTCLGEAGRDRHTATEGVDVGLQGQGGIYPGCSLTALRAVARLDVGDVSEGLASLGAVSHQLWMEHLPPSIVPCRVLRGLGKHTVCREGSSYAMGIKVIVSPMGRFKANQRVQKSKALLKGKN